MAASVGGFLTRHHLVRAQWPVRRLGPRALRVDRPRHHRRSDLRGGIALQIIAAGLHSTKQVEAGAW